MSIKAFYRDWVATTQRWSYLESGRTVEVYTPIVWMKANMQPFKDGFGFNSSDTGITFESYTLAYSKSDMDTEQPPEIPLGAEQIAADVRWVYFDGKWYYVVGDENWTHAGRAPKHYKYALKYSSQNQPDIGEPTPSAQLVEDFERAVWRLSYDIN